MTIEQLKELFIELYKESSEELRVFSAPGRVNLIGEHIDYCGGFVFPAALTLDTKVIVRKRSDRKIKLAATSLPDRVEMSLDDLEKGKELAWGNYQLGVAYELQNAGYQLVGVDMLFHTTVPFGSGLSSSASIEMATAIALATLGNEEHKTDKPLNKVELAIIGQRTENNYCNVNCGIMDQFASAMGKKDHAMLLDCANVSCKYTPLKLNGYKIVLGNTKKPRSLADSKYNERRSEVDAGFGILKSFLPDKKFLCDVTVVEFEKYKNEIKDEIIRKRVEHIVYENTRVLESFEALNEGNLLRFGQLLKEANDSISNLYEVTGFELDTMVAEALKVEGTVGARMTGAGFGGCTVNIVREDMVETFINQVGENYTKITGLVPEFYVSEIGEGAREIL